jgi:hypothetical protein
VTRDGERAIPVYFPEDLYQALALRKLHTGIPMTQLVVRYVEDGLAADRLTEQISDDLKEHTR